MEQYVTWANTNNITTFYTDPALRTMFKAYIQKLVTRVNTKTGVAYIDDPAIFGWELANEPLAPGDDSGDAVTVRCPACHSSIPGLHNNLGRMINLHTFC
jgi:endo-1,4-beta-mannosidase